MSVLVLDKSMAMRRVIRHTLARGGITGIVDTGAGTEAMIMLREVQPDVLIVGARLEDMSGLEFIARARSEACGQRTFIIMLSDESSPEDVMAAVSTGADEYIVIPYRDDYLAQKVRRALERFGVTEFAKDVPPPYLNRAFLKR